MATVINRKTPAILANSRNIGLEYLTLKERGFYFPKQTSFEIGANTEKYIHFVNDGDYWAFFVNDDRDGFKFSMDKDGTYHVNDRALSRMFTKATGKKEGDRLLVKKTKAIQMGAAVYEIYVKETADELVLREKQEKEYRKSALNISGYRRTKR